MATGKVPCGLFFSGIISDQLSTGLAAQFRINNRIYLSIDGSLVTIDTIQPKQDSASLGNGIPFAGSVLFETLFIEFSQLICDGHGSVDVE